MLDRCLASGVAQFREALALEMVMQRFVLDAGSSAVRELPTLVPSASPRLASPLTNPPRLQLDCLWKYVCYRLADHDREPLWPEQRFAFVATAVITVAAGQTANSSTLQDPNATFLPRGI